MNNAVTRMRNAIPALLGLLLLQACAVPVPPTGGPPDTTPPELELSAPVSGAVNVSTDRLVFEFSEPIDEASFRSAFTITPELGGPIELRGSSRRLVIRLPDSLRAGTTYRVTLDVTLRDRRGVALDAPITLAFATGPEIDTARLSGRMLHASDGRAASGIDVLAYASADSSSLADGPLFRTQTGTDGEFRLDFLPEQSFFVLGLQDRNLNKVIDEGEWIAVPPVSAIQADTTDSPIEVPWLLSNPDNTPPLVERVRATASNELEIRLSEPLGLVLDEPMLPGDALIATDSTGTRSLPVSALWFRQDRPRNLYGQVEGLTPGSWRLGGQLAQTDSTGNAASDPDLAFVVPEGLPAPDPVQLMTWTPDSLDASPDVDGLPDDIRTVWPMERPGFRLNRPDSLVEIAFSDSSGQPLAIEARQGDATWYTWNSELQGSDPYRVSVSIPEEDSTRSIWLRNATARELGALGIVVQSREGANEAINAHLYPLSDDARVIDEVLLRGDIALFEGLPRGFRGRVVVFEDQDGDGRWSPGSLIPFAAAEPVRWYEFEEPVRPRWDTIAADTLFFDTESSLDPAMVPDEEE